LYTQCSHCDTVFQLTAETLRTAGGQVRCGRCGEVFNALARLAEDANAFATPGDGPPRESALEMEARADEILRSPAPKPPMKTSPASDDEDFASGDVEFARLQLIEKFKPPRHENPAPQRPAPPGSAAPVPPRSPVPKAKAAPPASATAPPGSAIDPADDEAFEFTLPPGELDRVFVDPTAGRVRTSSGADVAAAAGETAAEEAAAPSARPPDESGEPVGERMGGPQVAEHARRDVLAGLREARLEDPLEPANPAMRLAWGAAAAVLTLALLGQVIHENRAWLAAHGPLRGPLQSIYGALGVKVQPPVNLSAYQLRQWGVTGDPNTAGTLRVRASILNTSAQLQPYPLLRVTLANRYGTHVGARDFEPAEYLGRPTARLMTPGERADATLDIQDPGKDAEGFEIDVCLRGPEQASACAADAATQAGAPQADAPQADAPQAGAPRAKP
jgi:predicted Zn finger-like uncharacterized protein